MLMLLVGSILLHGCGGDGGTAPDTTPPAAVVDLGATSAGHDAIQLSWTAPGDDGGSGTASEYDIRYSETAITPADWDQCLECAGEPEPQTAGGSETHTVSGLVEGTPYYFALKVCDEVQNWSDLSNVASTVTSTVTDYVFLTGWGSKGSEAGQFDDPLDIAVGSSGYVYALDKANSRIQKFTSNGAFLLNWGSEGTGDGQFQNIYHLAVGPGGNVYVADTLNHRIQKFAPDGTFIAKWGNLGSLEGELRHPIGIAVDSSGRVYVADSGNDRIQVFAPAP